MNCEEETIPKALLEPIPRSPTPERALLNDQESDEMKCERPRFIIADEDKRSPGTPGTPSKRGKLLVAR